MPKYYYYYKNEHKVVMEDDAAEFDYNKHDKKDHCDKHDKKHDKKDHCDKHDKKDHKKESSKLVEFAYETSDPITELPLPLTFPLSTQPQVIATATLKDVEKGNVVWLNGLYHVNNNSPEFADVFTRIYRGNISPANLIYQSIVEVDAEGNDDATESVTQFVDVVPTDAKNVTYYLTAQKGPFSDDLSVFAYGPITFTAAEIKQ
ncbi:hypothetical protein FZC74_10440 [Sutcliffiella horikoshii]|uniref:Uncharacterized protein n=1 Tax=Sutcliffiella horikoshii TaxID=79883 RepID=A0AA95B641_9BACI|nr:hypothetical protein [Sutcliffiella horikoshii]TYS59148.1 hypothetical protein FZC74_10440 [Sutcliffiella horikoshii]